MAAFRYVGDRTKIKLEWGPRREGRDPPWVQGIYHWVVYDLLRVPAIPVGHLRIAPKLRAEADGVLYVARGERWPGAATLEDLAAQPPHDARFPRPPIGPRDPELWSRHRRVQIQDTRDMTPEDRRVALEEDAERARLLGSPEGYDRAALLLVKSWLAEGMPRHGFQTLDLKEGKGWRVFDPFLGNKLSPRIREDLQKYPPHVRRTEAWCCQGHADCKEFPELGRACFFQPRAARKRR